MNDLIALRPVEANDAAALMAFYNGLTPATIHTFRPLREKTTITVCEEIIKANLTTPRQRFDLGAWLGATMIGWAFLDGLDGSRPHFGLGIADEYQRQGLGSALLDELLHWAQGQKIAEIELMVVNDNAHAIYLYTSRGFTIYLEEYDEIDGLTYLYMRVVLTDELPLHIQGWSPSYPRWAHLQAAADGVGQTKWINVCFSWHRSNHLLVALKGGTIVGFLRLVTQYIGADEELPPTELAGQPLLEAKVMAFAVVESHRRQGIGRVLQEAALCLAKELGCYQLRSHSSGDKTANHQLKLTMGFALHRIVRGEDRQGGYFIMPLQSRCARKDQ
jgi:GNAT superfamily N-acetyltransferase